MGARRQEMAATHYVDFYSGPGKVFGEQLEGTLITVARTSSAGGIQPSARVRSYRLIGCENRLLRDRGFQRRHQDTRRRWAQDIGSPSFYEIEPLAPISRNGSPPILANGEAPSRGSRPDMKGNSLNLKTLRAPDGGKSQLIERPAWTATTRTRPGSPDFKFAHPQSLDMECCSRTPYKGDWTWDAVLRLADRGWVRGSRGLPFRIRDRISPARRSACRTGK